MVQQKSLLPQNALCWERFSVLLLLDMDLVGGTVPNSCGAQRSGSVMSCFFFAESIMKISTVNVYYKARHKCYCHIQSASLRFGHTRLKGHSILWKVANNSLCNVLLLLPDQFFIGYVRFSINALKFIITFSFS